MDNDGGSDYPPGPVDPNGVNAWFAIALVLGIAVGLVLLVMWGASASPGGGCGGG